jgi:cytochrome P450
MAQSPSQPVHDLAEINLADPDRFTEGVPHHWFRALRERAPVYWHPGNATVGNGFWCVTRYEDVKEVSRNPQVYSSERGGTNIPDMPEEGLQQVRTQHCDLRRAFAPDAMQGPGPRRTFSRRRQVVGQLLDAALQIRLQVLGALVLRNRTQHLFQAVEPTAVVLRYAIRLLGTLVIRTQVGWHSGRPSGRRTRTSSRHFTARRSARSL